MSLRRIWILPLDKLSIDVNYIQLVDGVVEFICVLPDFLPAGFISERGVEVSN